MYLVHFVADEHMPLHAVGDDRGETRKSVTFMGVKKNLHSLWDDLIMPEDWRAQAKMDPAPYVKTVEKYIPKDAASLTQGDFIDAAVLESLAIAKDKILPRYAKDHGAGLGEEYQKEMQPIAFKRLAEAGVRLAALLERDLAPQIP